jgi:FxsC-like protein
VYAEKGLLLLLKQKARYEAEYQEFVSELARRLVLNARKVTLPRWDQVPARLAEVPSAFGQATPVRSGSGAGSLPTSDRAGPGAAQFVFVVGRETELRQLRQRVEAYDDESAYWRPFAPEVTDAVGLISGRAATQERLVYEPLPVGDDLMDRLRVAEEKNKIVLFVVDPWSAGIDPYRDCLVKYDEKSFVNCGILVPYAGDEETAAMREALHQGLQRSLFRTFITNSSYLRDGIDSADELERELITAIGEVRKRIIRYKEVSRPRPGGDQRPIPQISGPGGGTP